jgi:hypothetical protein
MNRLWVYVLVVLSFLANPLPVRPQIASKTSQSDKEYQSTIRGRVVDDRGAPIPGARILFDVSGELYAKFCWAKKESVWADANGEFAHHEYCTQPERTATLYIMSPIDRGKVQVPIFAPYWPALRRNDARFVGIPVLVREDRDINLGAVQLPVWFRPVQLSIKDARGKNYFKTADDWSRYVLIVKDQAGNSVGSDSLSINDIEEKVDVRDGSVRLALPEGKWTLQLLRRWEDMDRNGQVHRYLGQTRVVVAKSNSVPTIRLVVKGRR